MKTVLVPIDFSLTSINALLFAAELSRRAGCNLVVVNVVSKGEDLEEAESKLKSTDAKLIKSFGSDLRYELSVVRGTLVNVLKKIMTERHPDIIVMGTKGASGLKKIVMGSNTVNVLAKTKAPVLVIPNAAKFENFLRKGKNRIVLASDLHKLKSDSALEVLKKMALLLIEPKVRVVSVRPKSTVLRDLSVMQRDFIVSFFKPEIDSERITVFSPNVIRGINLYLGKKNKDTGLIAMIARDSGHLIQKHYTREMASHTHLPLLVMHDR